MTNKILGAVAAIAIMFTLGSADAANAQGNRKHQKETVIVKVHRAPIKGQYRNGQMQNRKGKHHRHLTIQQRKAIIRQNKVAIHRQKRAIQMQRERRARRGVQSYGYAR